MAKAKDVASRAVISPMLSQRQRDALIYTPQCRQRWGERQVGGIPSPLRTKDIEEFLTKFAWLNETEVALQCLFDGGFDLPKSVQLLHAARREKHKTQRDRDEQFDPQAFENAIGTHGKKFHLVKQALGQGATTRDAVSRYYLWKRTTEFKVWQRGQTVKKCKKKKKEIERLRLGNELDIDPEGGAFQGYHNKQCELCATGGKLLCCDGCAKAYHFSCVQPPITRIRKGDDAWFCPYCQDVFGGAKPKMMPSHENEFCQVCLPFTGMPRTLYELMADSSSQEEDDELEVNSGVNSDDDNAGLEWNDETSDHDAKAPDVSNTKKLILTTGYPGSVRDYDDLKMTSTIALSCFSTADRLKSSEERNGAVVLSQVASDNPIEANPAMRRAVVLSEKAISGRKRHRKTMTPRRISPSRFDNSSNVEDPSTFLGRKQVKKRDRRENPAFGKMVKNASTRAEIPALLSIEQQLRPTYQQRWGWQDGQQPGLTPREITEFVRTYAWPKEKEMALQCLFEAGYDVSRAVEIIHEARRQNLRLNREETKRIQTSIFEKAMGRHGKNFQLVKRRLGRKVTTQELVSKFYMWKITPEYEKWHDDQREKKRKMEAKRLKHFHPAMDQHREYCEVCFKGGKLLCCDGCERACHLNCVRPALLDVPEGEWFCSHCRDEAPISTGSDASTSISKMKTKANVTRIQGDHKKRIEEQLPPTIEKCPEKRYPTASIKFEVAPDGFITENLDGISDITTGSESDGGVAKVFQSHTSNYVVPLPLKKPKQKCSKLETVVVRPRCKLASRLHENGGQLKDVREVILPLRSPIYAKNETVVGRPRYSSPASSLEYCSHVQPVYREVKPLQLMTASSSRKRKRQFEDSCNSLRFPAVREVTRTESLCFH